MKFGNYLFKNLMPFVLIVLSIFILQCTPASSQEDTRHPHNYCGTASSQQHDFKNGHKVLKIQERPVLSLQFLSPSKRFLIHYDISGANAVDTKDENNNGIPDYVDSAAIFFDYAYQVEVIEIGYNPPPIDDVNNPAYDIYLVDNISTQYIYGITDIDSIVSESPLRRTTFIRVDNDYSSRDSILIGGTKRRAFFDTSYAALKAIAAHEFFHAIHLGYGHTANVLLRELISTWMEYRVHPDTRAYEEFLPSLFNNLPAFPFSEDSDQSGYRYAIFGQYVHALYGDDLFKRMWELIGTDKSSSLSAYRFLDSAFKERQSSLADVWCGFLPWMYFTGERAQGERFFKNAATYPEVLFFYDSVFTSPSTTLSGKLLPYELRYLRILLPETSLGGSVTLDIALANIDTEGLVARDSRKQDYNLTVTRTFEAGSRNIPGTPYYINLQHNDKICDTLFISGAIQSIANAYPNPFQPGVDREAFFPIPSEAISNGRASLTIFKSDVEPAYTATLPVEILDGSFVARWTEIPESLTSGVYIYSVTAGDDIFMGKIVIQR